MSVLTLLRELHNLTFVKFGGNSKFVIVQLAVSIHCPRFFFLLDATWDECIAIFSLPNRISYGKLEMGQALLFTLLLLYIKYREGVFFIFIN